jgi:hypothetical protein
MNGSRHKLPAKNCLHHSLARHTSATNGWHNKNKVDCDSRLSHGDLDYEPLEEENPGLVRGMKQPGAGVETEAGPE